MVKWHDGAYDPWHDTGWPEEDHASGSGSEWHSHHAEGEEGHEECRKWDYISKGTTVAYKRPYQGRSKGKAKGKGKGKWEGYGVASSGCGAASCDAWPDHIHEGKGKGKVKASTHGQGHMSRPEHTNGRCRFRMVIGFRTLIGHHLLQMRTLTRQTQKLRRKSSPKNNWLMPHPS